VDHKGKPKYRQISFIGTPAPKDIALVAFGLKASDKLIKATVERLLPCIVDRARLPYDIVNAAVNRSIKPISMETYEWEKVRSITCALVRKYRQERFEKEEWSMELDKTVTDTHYLFGRLLAVADEIENWALYEMKEERATSAIRLFERFAQNPSKTWGIISKRLIPYQNKLGKKCEWLLDIKEDVSQKINFEEFNSQKNLDGRFILGFDCQKKDIRDEKIRRAEAKNNQKDHNQTRRENENE
jgi:CRISPR-associated protein Csd1